MSNHLKKRAHIRRVCRKCGARLVNKPEYGVICPECGWTFVSWTDYEEGGKESEKNENRA